MGTGKFRLSQWCEIHGAKYTITCNDGRYKSAAYTGQVDGVKIITPEGEEKEIVAHADHPGDIHEAICEMMSGAKISYEYGFTSTPYLV